MTFTEAAAEILRLVGRPLHYKKITELAIERNLLSHVGKAPELTMSSRLATIVKKDKSEGGLIKVKPGVFALRTFSKAALALADSAEEVDLSQLPPPDVSPPAPLIRDPARFPRGEATESEEGDEHAEGTPPEPRRLPGADVFPIEEDDDRPILANLDEPSDKDADGDNEEGRKGRRRRRRRGRKDDDMTEPTEAEGASGAEGEARPAEARAEGETTERRPEREGRGDRGDRGGRDRGRDRHGRDREHREARGGDRGERDRGERDRGERDRGERDRGERDRGERDRHDREARERDGGRRFGRDGNRPPDVDLTREPAEGDLLGKELADACYHVLRDADAVPVTYADLARLLVQRGRLSGDPAALAPTVAAAVRADIARGETGRMARPRFRHAPTPSGVGGVALSGWYYSRDVVHRERDAMRAVERYVEQLRRSFLRKLGDLPAGGFAELIATWLNSEGVGSLRGVRRPYSSTTEMHFAGVRRRGPEEVRIGIVVLRGTASNVGRDEGGGSLPVGRERVTEMRGSAHHYGNATELWILTTGTVQSGAREEAGAQASIPVALFDGASLAESMEKARIGLVPVSMMVPSIDLDLFDALRGSAELPARDRDRDREREPRSEGRPEGRPERSEGRPEGRRQEQQPQEGEREAPSGESGEGAAEAPAAAAPGVAAARREEGEEGEGGRRRRRRRRRRGGRDAVEGAPGAAAEAGDESGESESGDEESAESVETSESGDMDRETGSDPDATDRDETPSVDREPSEAEQPDDAEEDAGSAGDSEDDDE